MISNMDDLGNEANVVFVQEGATVGEVEALLKRKDVLFGAKAYTECVLLRMPVVDFDYIKATYSNFSNHLAEMLANKIYLSSINTIQYQQMEAITRLKRLLGNCEPGRVRQTRRELGDACGVSERTIQRVVKKMYEEGYLSLERGKIVLTEKQLDLIRKENRQKLSGF